MKALGQFPTDLYDRMLWEYAHLGEFCPRTIAEKDSLELDSGKLVVPQFDLQQDQSWAVEEL